MVDKQRSRQDEDEVFSYICVNEFYLLRYVSWALFDSPFESLLLKNQVHIKFDSEEGDSIKDGHLFDPPTLMF